MITPISNEALLEKCREFIVADRVREGLNPAIKDALISANREIANLGGYQPLAWMRHYYDELFSRVYAGISDITQADPGVITAESEDPDISDNHGFVTDDVVWIQGIAGMERLNCRFFLVTKITDTTLSLKQLDNENVIDTTDYEEWESGGYIYHAGIKLPADTIEPQAGKDDYKWKIKRVWKVTTDGRPVDPASEETMKSDPAMREVAGDIYNWRYWRRMSHTDPTSYDHFILWAPPVSTRHVIGASIEKGFPDLSTWTTAVSPPHPPEVHDFVWHRALANLITNAEKQRRESKSGERIMGQIEVLFAQRWLNQVALDDAEIKRLSKSMLGDQPSAQGWSA